MNTFIITKNRCLGDLFTLDLFNQIYYDNYAILTVFLSTIRGRSSVG